MTVVTLHLKDELVTTSTYCVSLCFYFKFMFSFAALGYKKLHINGRLDFQHLIDAFHQRFHNKHDQTNDQSGKLCAISFSFLFFGE